MCQRDRAWLRRLLHRFRRPRYSSRPHEAGIAVQHHSRVGAGRGRGVFLKSKLCIFIYMPALDRSISVIAGDGGGDGGAAGVSKNHESCIKNMEFCIKQQGITRNYTEFVLKMMNFADSCCKTTVRFALKKR